jgi:phosphoglycolate phosphatase-like HAD superfamily hydrolase
MSIRAVFLDMGGTIQTFGYTRELRLAATPGIETILQSAGIHSGLSNVELLRVITEGLSRYHAWSLETMLELPPQRVWREFIFPGYPVDVDAMDSVAEEVTLYIETHYYQREMRPEMPKVLKSIKKLGLKIGLISNVCSRGQVPQNLNEYGIQDYFSPVNTDAGNRILQFFTMQLVSQMYPQVNAFTWATGSHAIFSGRARRVSDMPSKSGMILSTVNQMKERHRISASTV